MKNDAIKNLKDMVFLSKMMLLAKGLFRNDDSAYRHGVNYPGAVFTAMAKLRKCYPNWVNMNFVQVLNGFDHIDSKRRA
jgi:hypothetical protein